MPIFRRKSKNSQPVAQAEQAVLVHIAAMASEDNGLDQVEDPLIEAIANAAVGEFDGNDIGPDGAVLYMYGPDANALVDVVEPVLQASPLGPGAFVPRSRADRRGDPRIQGAVSARNELKRTVRTQRVYLSAGALKRYGGPGAPETRVDLD